MNVTTQCFGDVACVVKSTLPEAIALCDNNQLIDRCFYAHKHT